MGYSLHKVHKWKYLNIKLIWQRKLYDIKYEEYKNVAGYMQNVMELYKLYKGMI